MTDYKNLKLIASSSPHIRSKDNTRSIMLDVIIALLPALVMSIYVFGVRALTMVLVSVAACVFWEWAYRKLLKKPQSIGDLSAVVTGILLAFVCPPTTPVWMLIIGGFFSIVALRRHRLQLRQSRSGGPCHAAGQLCQRHDPLGGLRLQAASGGLHRRRGDQLHPHGCDEGHLLRRDG